MHTPPLSLAAEVQNEIGAEGILWSASPDSWRYASRHLKQSLYAIPFTAFALFWTISAGGFSMGKPVSAFFLLWGCVFIGLGLSMLLAPAFQAWKACRVYYVITEDRAIIFEKVWGLKIHSFEARSLSGFERVSKGGPAGDLVFHRSIERHGRGSKVTELGFLGLADFAPGEQALRALVDRGRSRTE